MPRFADRVAVNGLAVSPFCLGATTSPDVIEAAFEAGINFFFLSGDMHWPMYEPSRQGLARLFKRPGARDQIVVCASLYVTQPEFCAHPFTEVLEAVPGLGRIDVLSAGGCSRDNFTSRLPVYQAHRAEAYCGARAIAASFHHRDTAREVMSQRSIDLGFIRFNPMHPGALTDYFPSVSAAWAPTFAFKTAYAALSPGELAAVGVTDDQWMPKVSDHYRYALTEPRLDGLLFTVDTTAQLAELDDALAQGGLDLEECGYLDELTAAAFKKPSQGHARGT